MVHIRFALRCTQFNYTVDVLNLIHCKTPVHLYHADFITAGISDFVTTYTTLTADQQCMYLIQFVEYHMCSYVPLYKLLIDMPMKLTFIWHEGPGLYQRRLCQNQMAWLILFVGPDQADVCRIKQGAYLTMVHLAIMYVHTKRITSINPDPMILLISICILPFLMQHLLSPRSVCVHIMLPSCVYSLGRIIWTRQAYHSEQPQ